MNMDDDLIKLLAELGFIAGGYGLIAQTDAIVGALEALRPDSERPYLIQALARINFRDAAGAERILREQALKLNPDSAMAKAYLGLALHVQGRINERDRILEEAIASGDEEAAALAQRLSETPPD
ncbi:MAG TPA: HrpB1 family type III secretion system apparatus protein [Candidatus Competibacteraceae bacterium]|nr:HrpB1 family type III secretion system apparatus protein [Candidatus Competibacteraceae bacterium]HQA24768.1 HrpB1 family type III secretion system apparatus protein [Candidatus Competibacteraceae bacterium]HQD55478.1 HrpB1 family type III secretion system apparatus protein [Candidatus Competibacteraceae bacterium]